MLLSKAGAYLYKLQTTIAGLLGTNTLANLLIASVTKKKCFVTSTPGVKVIKLFFVTDDEA